MMRVLPDSVVFYNPSPILYTAFCRLSSARAGKKENQFRAALAAITKRRAKKRRRSCRYNKKAD
jgi:hypothetical protein